MKYCFMSTETVGSLGTGAQDLDFNTAPGLRYGGWGVGGWGSGEERLYTCRYIVTTRMTPALRRAAMRAILMFH